MIHEGELKLSLLSVHLHFFVWSRHRLKKGVSILHALVKISQKEDFCHGVILPFHPNNIVQIVVEMARGCSNNNSNRRKRRKIK